MPDLDNPLPAFKAQGFEVLGITDEDASTVATFSLERGTFRMQSCLIREGRRANCIKSPEYP
jgi:hypothetical protein